jgi:hypothetical protein
MNSQIVPTVNYDEGALVELEIEGTEYRVDSGKQGTALCVSSRNAGTWSWELVGEARWDGRALRIQCIERRVVERLSQELAQAIQAM